MNLQKTAGKERRVNMRLFLSLFLPYLAIIVLIGGISMFVAFKAMNSLEKETVAAGREKAETIYAKINQELFDNLPVLASLENSYQVKEMLDTAKGGSPDFSMAIYYFQKEMIQKLTNANYLAAYLPEKGYLVTTQSGFDDRLLPLFLQSTGISKEELDSLLDKKYNARFMNAQHSWITSRNEFSDGTQVLMIADYNFINVIRDTLEDGELFAVGADGRVMYTDSPRFSGMTYESLFSAEDGRILTIDGEEFVQVRAGTPFEDVNMMLAIPLGVLGDELSAFRRIILWALLGALLFSFLISLYRSGTVYTSLQELAHVSGKKKEALSALEVIQGSGAHISMLNRENFQIHQEINEVTPVMLGKALGRLISESEEDQKGRAENVLAMGELDPKRPVAVFGVGVLEDEDGLFAERQEEQFGRNGIEYFVLNNFLRDLLFERQGGIMANLDGYYLVLTNTDGNPQTVSQAAGELETACRQYLRATVVTTPVYQASKPEELSSCVRQAQDKIVRDLFWGNEESWTEIPERSYQSYIENIRNLVNALTVKNYNEAQTILDNIIALELPGDETDIRKAIYRMYGTIGIVTAVIESQTGANWESAGEIDYGGKLYRVKNVREFREKSKRILTELIRFKEQYQKNVIPDIVIQARDYIEKHYTDSGFNATSVADALGVGDSYLTRMFRTYMGTNVLEYIQRKRMEKAKELLKTQTVKDTANMIGLWDTQAMIRLFRKYEGLTPGAYKDMLAQKDNTPGNV